jgi:hypothetical protein
MEPTIVSTSTGSISIAYDYSIYLERIASSLESISTSLSTISALSTSTGIRVESPYDWTRPTEMYSWYNQNLDLFALSTSTVERLTAAISTVTNYMPKFQ